MSRGCQKFHFRYFPVACSQTSSFARKPLVLRHRYMVYASMWQVSSGLKEDEMRSQVPQCHGGCRKECRTKHPTDKTPHAHFLIGGQKPPHVFSRLTKHPTPKSVTWTKHPMQILKLGQNPPSCFCSVDKQMEADRSILMQTSCIF